MMTLPPSGATRPAMGVKTGGFARFVWPQQRHNLAPAQRDRYVADHWALAIAFAQADDLQADIACLDGQVGG